MNIRPESPHGALQHTIIAARINKWSPNPSHRLATCQTPACKRSRPASSNNKPTHVSPFQIGHRAGSGGSQQICKVRQMGPASSPNRGSASFFGCLKMPAGLHAGPTTSFCGAMSGPTLGFGEILASLVLDYREIAR